MSRNPNNILALIDICNVMIMNSQLNVQMAMGTRD